MILTGRCRHMTSMTHSVLLLLIYFQWWYPSRKLDFSRTELERNRFDPVRRDGGSLEAKANAIVINFGRRVSYDYCCGGNWWRYSER